MSFDLMSYMPEYYQESPQMRAIMDAVASYMPDVDGEMWQSFFISLLSDKSIDLWRKEFNVQSKEELVARLRSSGMMNRETLLAQGFHVHETYMDMPEDGLTLSDSGVMADGREFMPLTTLMYTTPETLMVARGLVKLMGLSGFQYLFAVVLSEQVKAQQVKIGRDRTVWTGINRLDQTSETMSGSERFREQSNGVSFISKTEMERESWWSPVVFFNDSVKFPDTKLTRQESDITISN
jgi:hypothetical protein